MAKRKKERNCYFLALQLIRYRRRKSIHLVLFILSMYCDCHVRKYDKRCAHKRSLNDMPTRAGRKWRVELPKRRRAQKFRLLEAAAATRWFRMR